MYHFLVILKIFYYSGNFYDELRNNQATIKARNRNKRRYEKRNRKRGGNNTRNGYTVLYYQEAPQA